MKGRLKYPVVLLPVLMLYSGLAQAELYRWVDDAGQVHYADIVPPSVVKRDHSKLDQRGMMVETISAAPTPEQIAARKRRETLAKLREAMENRQQEQDQHLLANYADVSELEAVFRSKLEVLEQNTRLMEERKAALQERLAAIQGSRHKVRGTTEYARLQQYIEDAEATLREYDHALQENQTEHSRLHYRFEQERQRLRRLLSDGSASSPRPDPSIIPVTLRAELDHQ